MRAALRPVGRTIPLGVSTAIRAMGSRQHVIKQVDDRGAVPEPGEPVVCGLIAECLAGIDKLFLQIENPLARAKADLQLCRIKWLRYVVVGSGVEPCDDVVL